MRNSIRGRLILVFIGLAVVPLLLVGVILAWQSFSSLQQQALSLQQEAAKRVNSQVVAFFQELENELRFTVQTQGLDNSSLSNLLAYQPAFDELHLLNSQGREQAGVYRLSFAATPVDRSTADEFVIPKSTGQIYYGPVLYDQTTNEPLMVIAIPVVNLRTGSVDNVLVAVTRVKKVWDLIAGIQVSPGQSIYIVDAQGKVVAHRNPSVVLRDTRFNLPNQNGIQPGLNGESVVLAFDTMSLGQQQLSIVAEQTLAEALAPAINIVFVTLFLLVVMAGIAITLGLLSVRQIVQPIEALVKTAQAISTGDLSKQVEVTSRDEIGNLAEAFNRMTFQLRDLIGSLEQRVADRTKALSTVSEISTAASTILDIDKLLQEVVTVSKERFGLYHAHIYLLDESEENLVLASGAGEPGRQMVAQGRSIPLAQEKSLVARAAREREGVTVNDVTQEPDFLPNPLLPDTHSELAVPMMVGEKVIGVFDVQSDVVGRFTEADIAVQTTLASQIASAVQNARSYTEVQRSQALLSDALKVARIGNWEYDLEKDLFTFNEHFYSIFRTSVEQVGGYKISSADYARIFVHPDDAALVGAEIQRSIESKERFFQANLEHRIIFADGEIGYITVNINLERDEDGKIIRWYGANQDVTERRQLEEITRGRAKREESLNRITQKIQGTTTMAEALQVVARELGHALGNKSTLVMLDPDAMPDKSLTIQGAADPVPNPETT